MVSPDIAIIAAVVFVFSLISRRIEPTVLSGPMVFVAVGLLFAPEVLNIVDLGLETHAIELIGEFTLGIVLFSDATRIDARSLRREFRLPARLLGIGLPLTVALGTAIVYLLFDGTSVWEAALIAAILAPTDAALGQEVLTDESVPARIRHGLGVESGLNDGLIVPAVAVFLTLVTVEGESLDAAFWLRFVGRQVGIGAAVGIGVGALGAFLLTGFARKGWVDGAHGQLATLALGIFALTASINLDGNGFIAAFVAGIAFGTLCPDAGHLSELTEDVAQGAAAISFFLFGNVLLASALGDVTIAIVVCAIATLTVGRMLPVAISMIGSGAAWPTRIFVGWFGPRGLASILFGLILLDEGVESSNAFAVVAWTVLLSVVLHGASAAWGAKTYGRWFAAMEDEADGMPEGGVVEVMPVFRRYGSSAADQLP